MSKIKDIAKLKPIAELLKERDLAAFAQANQKRQAILARLTDLGDPLPRSASLDALPLAIYAELEEGHNLWRANLRKRLNTELARASSDWIEKRDLAVKAFGRSVLIDQLAGSGKTGRALSKR